MSNLKHLFGLHSIILEQFRVGPLNFIETGCKEGEGIAWALEHGFYSIQSCDINQRYVDTCNSFLDGDNDIVVCQNSLAFLKHVVLTAPTVFWLDAHDKTMDTFPVLEELKILRMKGVLYERSLILIDDVDAMPGCPFTHHRTLDSPQFVDVEELLQQTHDTGFLFDTKVRRPVLVGMPKPLVTKPKVA